MTATDYADVFIQSKFSGKPWWKSSVKQCWANSSSWESQTDLSCRLHCLGSSSLSMWSQGWATWAWSSSLRWTPGCRHHVLLSQTPGPYWSWLSTTVEPKMLVNFLADQNEIFYNVCAIQGAFYIMFIISEPFILAAMSYDHYLVICNLLLYTVIMSKRACWMLGAISYVFSTFVSLLIIIKNLIYPSMATM